MGEGSRGGDPAPLEHRTFSEAATSPRKSAVFGVPAAAPDAHVQIWDLFGTRLGCCQAKGISQPCLLNTDSVPSITPGTVDEKKTYHACVALACDRAGGDTQGKPCQSRAYCRMNRGARSAGAQGAGPREGLGGGAPACAQACPGSRAPAAVCPWASHLTSLSLRFLTSTYELPPFCR